MLEVEIEEHTQQSHLESALLSVTWTLRPPHMCTMLQTPPSASGVLHPPPPGAAAGVPVSAGSPHQAAAAAAAAAAGATNLFPTFLQGSPPPGLAPGATHLGPPHDPLFPHLPHHQMHHPHHPQMPPHHHPLSHPPFLPPEPPKPRFLFRMPRVVPNQKEKFDSDDLMKRHTREGEVSKAFSQCGWVGSRIPQVGGCLICLSLIEGCYKYLSQKYVCLA